MRGEVPTIRPDVPMPRGDAEWFAQMIGEPRPAMRRANRQSSIRNHQSQAVYEYDVYGQVAADPGHPNRFAFTGRRFDPETGLYYYRARYYNPTIGRFLQTDPIGYGDGMNWYAYCGNNSVNRTDPFGWMSEEEYNRQYPILGIHVKIGPSGDFGHAWISYTKGGVTTTYGLWHDSVLDPELGEASRVRSDSDLRVNLELGGAGSNPTASRYVRLTPEQAAAFEEWVNEPHTYNYYFGLIPTNNCASWAAETWDRITGEEIDADGWFGLEEPLELAQNIQELEYMDPTSDLAPKDANDASNSSSSSSSSSSASSW